MFRLMTLKLNAGRTLASRSTLQCLEPLTPLRSLHASASFDDSSTPSNSDTLVPPVPPQPTFSEEVVRAEKAPAPIPLPQKTTTTHTTTTERTTVTHTTETIEVPA